MTRVGCNSSSEGQENSMNWLFWSTTALVMIMQFKIYVEPREKRVSVGTRRSLRGSSIRSCRLSCSNWNPATSSPPSPNARRCRRQAHKSPTVVVTSTLKLGTMTVPDPNASTRKKKCNSFGHNKANEQLSTTAFLGTTKLVPDNQSPRTKSNALLNAADDDGICCSLIIIYLVTVCIRYHGNRSSSESCKKSPTTRWVAPFWQCNVVVNSQGPVRWGKITGNVFDFFCCCIFFDWSSTLCDKIFFRFLWYCARSLTETSTHMHVRFFCSHVCQQNSFQTTNVCMYVCEALLSASPELHLSDVVWVWVSVR